jgi:hypothetical protein
MNGTIYGECGHCGGKLPWYPDLRSEVDTLTARAEKAEAERDALRIRLDDCIVALAQTGAGSIVIDDPDEEGQ